MSVGDAAGITDHRALEGWGKSSESRIRSVTDFSNYGISSDVSGCRRTVGRWLNTGPRLVLSCCTGRFLACCSSNTRICGVPDNESSNLPLRRVAVGQNGRMGFNLAALVYRHDAEATVPSATDLVSILFPRSKYESPGLSTLEQDGFPSRGEINIGTFEQGTVVATRDAMLFNPTKLGKRYLNAPLSRDLVLLTQQSAHDMFAFGHWIDGQLQRSISVNPVGKVWESIGDPESFEKPFWAGERPAGPDYPLPFHPLDMAEAAIRTYLGIYVEGQPTPGLVGPDRIQLKMFRPASS